MLTIRLALLFAGAFVITATEVAAQARSPGTAVVWVDDGEYTIPIECEDASQPELGFSTEPSRITRERTGRSSLITLRVRQWRDTDENIVSLDRYVAWMPRPSSAGGVLSVTLDMSPASVLRDNMPVALTYDMWTSGDRPEGIQGVRFEAQCATRDPDAPSYRKVTGPT